MKILLLLLFVFFSLGVHSQVQFLSSGSNGELILSTTTGCCEKSLGFYDNYIDIAVSPNGTIYGLNGDIFEIDTATMTAFAVSTPIDQYGNYSAGAGLVAFDDNFLLSDRDDSLFIIEINTGIATNLGKIGHYCNGDFAFYNGDLYMASEINELIRITLDPIILNIGTVENLGVMSLWGAVYSLFTTYDGFNSTSKSLYAIDGNSVYKVNTSNAGLELVCTFSSEHGSYGGASIYDFDNTIWSQTIPNVFTPNNDGVNDYFMIPESYNASSVVILNRWGNIIYEWTEGEKKWNGQDKQGKEVSEGVYFYIIEFLDCNEIYQIDGNITILR